MDKKFWIKNFTSKFQLHLVLFSVFVVVVVVVVVVVLSFCLFRAVPVAYGGSQVGGPVGAVASSLHQSHSNLVSEPRLRPTPQQHQILNPLSESRDQTPVLGC